MQQIDLAERFVASRFPAASVAIVAGSTASGTRTASSDIDLLLIGDDMLAANAASLAATFAFDGEILEVFAYTPSGFEQWAQRGLDEYRPVVLDMLIEGIPFRVRSVRAARQMAPGLGRRAKGVRA